ncbi:MAG: hypothetical protein AABY76_05080, partial [Planctomycetota bacterium]
AIMNCEVTTDEKHGLIVNGEAVSQNNDLNQLSPQVGQSTETLGKPPAQVVSDSGYFIPFYCTKAVHAKFIWHSLKANPNSA